MPMLKQVRLCGLGGQGIVLAGMILGQAAVREGRCVAGSSSYGAQARGGYCRADVLIADGPIVYPHVIEADILIAMSQRAYDRYTKALASGAVILLDEQLVSPHPIDGVKQVEIPATRVAIKEMAERQVANMVMLGACVALTGLISEEALLWAIEHHIAARFRDLNLRAVRKGLELRGKIWR